MTLTLAQSAAATLNPLPSHTLPRYSLRKTARIFGCHEKTFREWMRDGGIPLPNGERVFIQCVPLGWRKIEFEQDEVQRVYEELKRRINEMLGLLAFPEDEVEREERRARGKARRALAPDERQRR